MKQVKPKQDLSIEVLRKENTEKLNPTGGSLEYEVGKHTETGEPHLRISQNSSNGYFSAEWLPISVIQTCLSSYQPDTSFNSRSLRSVFQFGKSANNASFLAAALRHEGLLKPHDTKKFQHHIDTESGKWPELLLSKKPKGKPVVTGKSK